MALGRGERPPLIVIVGPTAAGKSDLAVAAAEWFDGEVISADAFQVYRGLDIGTGKVGAGVRRRVPHHCLDIADPGERFSAGRYARAASAAIADVHSRGRIAVVAGGSGFYIRALLDGLAPLPRQDPRWRAALESIERRRGSAHLFEMLCALDRGWADAIGPGDRQRLLRGLEVTFRCGEPMSAMLERSGWVGPRYDAIWVALTWPRARLYRRIEERIDLMLDDGWLAEVRGLLRAGQPAGAPGLRAIGYRQLVAHLQGEVALEEARDRIVRATRRYAKRQMTWFRGQTPATWFELGGSDGATKVHVYAKVREHVQENLAC